MQVSGIILDEFDEPLVGAHVVVLNGSKETSVGDVTDFDGKFTINDISVGLTTPLKISFTGYKTIVVPAAVFGAKKPIKLEFDSKVLNEYTGYGYPKNKGFNYWWILALLPLGYIAYDTFKTTPKKVKI